MLSIVGVVRRRDFGANGDLLVGLDSPNIGQIFSGDTLSLAGWVMTREKQEIELQVVDDRGTQRLLLNSSRSDLQASSPSYFQNGQSPTCGFRHSLPISKNMGVSIVAGDAVHPFLEVSFERLDGIDDNQLFDRVIKTYMVSDKVSKPLLSDQGADKAAIVTDVWRVAAICDAQKNNQEITSALTQFRQKYGVEAVALLKERLNQRIFFPRQRELTHHGAMRTFRFWDEAEIDEHLADVAGFLEHLGKMGYPSFIYCGTLLGILRDNSLIPHDDDIDTICMLPMDPDMTVPDYVKRMEEVLIEAGAKVSGDYPHHRHVSVGKRSFDVFLGVDYGENLTLYSYRTISCPREEVYPQIPLDFRDCTYQVPQISEKLMERYYGPTWRIPDKNFYDN